MKVTEKILLAAEFAAHRHRGVSRKGRDEPYVCHPLRVARTVAGITDDEDTIVAAILHDTVEDTDATIAEIEAIFGEAVASLVAENTDRPNLSPNAQKEEQLRKIASKSTKAQIIKIADIIDNGGDMIDHPPPWRRTSIVGYLINKNKQVELATVPTTLVDRWAAIWTILEERYPEVRSKAR